MIIFTIRLTLSVIIYGWVGSKSDVSDDLIHGQFGTEFVAHHFEGISQHITAAYNFK